MQTEPNLLQISTADTEKSPYRKTYLWLGFSFILALIFTLAVINSFLQRRAIINHFKHEMNYAIKSLNQFDWDIAYDGISFNALYPSKLIEIENFKIYSRFKNRALNIEKLSLTNGFFSPEKLQLSADGSIDLVFDGDVHKINFGYNDIAIDLHRGEAPNNLTFRIQNLFISGWAEVKEINLASRIIAPLPINNQFPFIRTYLDIRNIKLNGLLNYPLGQNIERIYANAEIIGQISTQKDFKQEIHEWLSQDGYIAIKEFNLSWAPLLMVGKGELSFNENIQPVLQLNTSSKALLELVEDLEKKEWLDSKGAFVAKILLNNKAYKADEADKYLTVTTPISIQEDALLIEKIAVKKL